MKFSYVFLLLAVNFVTPVVTYYRKCYKEFSVCLITNTDEQSFENEFRLNQRSADDWCKRNSSSLAFITNANVQSAIEAFLNDSSAKLNSDVITNGYRYNLTYWEWIDGETWVNGKTSANNPFSERSYYRYGYLQASARRKATLNASIPTTRRNFICSYLSHNSNCPDGHHQLRSSCYKIHNSEAANWFDARNLCLKERYDLATFREIYVSSISRWLSNGEYWIGLRSEIWYWFNGQKYVEIKYSNWDTYSPYATGGNCLCLTANTGKWKVCDCSQEHRYICIKDYASNSNTSSEPRLSSSGGASHLQSTPSQIMDNYSTVNVEKTVINRSPIYTDSQRLIIWAPLAILIILIIVVAVVGAWIAIKKCRNRNNKPVVNEGLPINKTNQSRSSLDTYATLKPETSTESRTYEQLQIYETIRDDETE